MMYGRGPMMGGHRGPMGGPMHHRPMGLALEWVIVRWACGVGHIIARWNSSR